MIDMIPNCFLAINLQRTTTSEQHIVSTLPHFITINKDMEDMKL